jgi:predicted ATP-grasp superfamily ATP-dependent carboligase
MHEVQRSDIRGLSAALEFPVLIKPSRVHDIKTEMRGRKGWVARDAADYADVVASIPDHAGTLLVQEIVPGPESEITLFTAYFDQEGRAHQSFTCRKLRQYPPGFGSASLVVSEEEPETREIAEQFLAKIGYRGIAGVELKRDPRTGVRKMIEINPRPSLWFSASTESGKTITLSAYRDLACYGARQPETSQRNGVVWTYPLKDCYSAMFYRLKKDFILPPPNISAARGGNFRVSPVSVPGDRGPGVLELKNYIGKAVRRLLPNRK